MTCSTRLRRLRWVRQARQERQSSALSGVLQCSFVQRHASCMADLSEQLVGCVMLLHADQLERLMGYSRGVSPDGGMLWGYSAKGFVHCAACLTSILWLKLN